MVKPGNPGKNILNDIAMNRVPRRQTKIIKEAVKEKRILSEAQKAHIEKLNKLRAEQRAAEKLNPKPKPPKEELDSQEDEEDEINNDEILTKKEKKLKDDLIWVLEKLGGRRKILQMAKKSDALKVVIIKELLKVEVKELESRLRLKGAQQGGGPGFMFIISGLSDVKQIKDAGIDTRFLGNCLNPSEPIDIGKNNEEEEVLEP
jgi:hypothetical protein